MKETILLLVEIVRCLLQGTCVALVLVLTWLLIFRAAGWQGGLW